MAQIVRVKQVISRSCDAKKNGRTSVMTRFGHYGSRLQSLAESMGLDKDWKQNETEWECPHLCLCMDLRNKTWVDS